MRKKGRFCYEYIDSFEKLYETALPPIEAFHSKLNDKSCSVEDYEPAFKCKTRRDYTELYLKTDMHGNHVNEFTN